MNLAIFDLDNTLIAGDSDHAWGQFLIARSLVDADRTKLQNDQFYEQYQNGTLNILEYLEFVLDFLKGKTEEQLRPLHEEFMASSIEPILLPKAAELIAAHQAKGHETLIITATNRFITEPIARRLNIDNLIACEPEQIDGRYTGKVTGVPSFQHGKVTRLEAWLKERDQVITESWFYSDSHNDLPLLESVTYPVAVNPDSRLQAHAEKNEWSILDLRD